MVSPVRISSVKHNSRNIHHRPFHSFRYSSVMKRSTVRVCLFVALVFTCACYAEIEITFSPPVVLPVGGAGGDVTTVDIDADGDVDIIATTRNPYLLWVWINDGAGGFAPAISYEAGILPRALVAADFNNDGDIDIATANELQGDITVMVGNGAGGFSLPEHFSTSSRPMELAAEDFNHDGLIDLAVTHLGGDTGPLMVLINSGGIGAGWLGFKPPVAYAIGSGSRSVETLDIDGDGELDLVTTNRTDGTISVLLGNGNGTFDSAQTFFAASLPRDSVSGDFNGDGMVDLAIADFLGGWVWLLVNLGSDANGWLGLTSPSPWSTGGSGSHGIAAGDLDLDNDLDLIVANVQTGNLSVMLNDGKGGFAQTTVIGVGATSAASVVLADLDGDGDMDSVNSNAALSGSVTVLFNTTDTCPIDINDDGAVDTADLGILIGQFGTADPIADINGDGVVDTADLGILIGAFGTICP